MKHILSVDFDWIMRPDIELYNNYCGAAFRAEDLQAMWEFIAHKTQYKDFHCCEAQYADLVLFLRKMTRLLPKENIHFIMHHDEVLDVLNNKGYGEEEIVLINVDHHHDFGYPKTNKDDMSFDKFSTVANWVRCLYNENRLARYIWVGNENSDGIGQTEECLQDKFSFFTNLQTVDKYGYDEVIVCFSQEWIPPNIRPLFYVLKELILHDKEEQ